MDPEANGSPALSAEVRARVDFDRESIEQLVRARREPEPDIWVMDPAGYEAAGHVQRDSESVRLLAYSRAARAVYATDGCNACRHALDAPLETARSEDLASLSRYTQLPAALLEELRRKALTQP